MANVKILVCGDFVAIQPSKICISDKIKEIIEDVDIKICNFEAPISVDGELPLPKSGPSLCQSDESPQFLEKIGFNVILAANNHIMDYGRHSAESTVASFNNSLVLGVGTPQDAYTCKILQIKGKKIGILSLCQYEFGIVESVDDSNDYGVAWLNSLDVPDIIRKSKQKVDYLLVFPHAGLEEVDIPLPIWRSLYKKFVQWGADGVVASHPHVQQGWESFEGKPIFYSLGNFYFDALKGSPSWYQSIMVELELGDIITHKIHHVGFDTKGNVYMDETDLRHKHYEYLQSLIEDKNKYNLLLDEIGKGIIPSYKYSILKGIGGVPFRKLSFSMIIKLFVRSIINRNDGYLLLNMVRCETHRWLIEKYITN